MGSLRQIALWRSVSLPISKSCVVVPAVFLTVWLGADGAAAQLPLPTTIEDFEQPGTQPQTLVEPMLVSGNCASCHGFYDEAMAPHARWVGSMMAQSTRDPIFHAALAIAEQDAVASGEICLRCHAPSAWLDGRSEPTDGSALDASLGDFDGVSCHTCHRSVDPVYEAGVSPLVDEQILADLQLPPDGNPHSGQMVFDPFDRRRGPFDLGSDFFLHEWRESPWHRESKMCASCHDVSNPAFSRQADDSFKLNDLDAPHPTQAKKDEFPIERTYSEWEASVFAQAEIDVDGRFGGNRETVSSCQDCHMPDMTGVACAPGLGGETRDDLPQHDLAGANSWVLRAVRSLYPDIDTGLSAETVEASIARNLSMLERAADLEVFEDASGLVVRTINRSGHKLPTGYGEGRRMWLHIEVLDLSGGLLAEYGSYDLETATLNESGTRVYEIHHALDDYMAEQSGLPVGKSFHFVLNNSTTKDNRIPPRGYDSARFEEAQAPVVDHEYGEQHFWDDFRMALPDGAAKVVAELYHQTTTREYIEFLRDENITNNAGQQAYDLWVEHGKSEPVLMARQELTLDADVCATPIVYGLGRESRPGVRARLGWTGTPSVSAQDFEVFVVDGIPNAQAFLMLGLESASLPHPAGNRLIKNPKRVGSAVLDGSGRARFDVPVQNATVGEEYFMQLVYRDPVSTELYVSEGLHVDVCR